VPPGRHGEGQITITSFSVPPGSLGFWKTRLAERGEEVRDVAPIFGEAAIAWRKAHPARRKRQ
jgi:glyoxalase family protein